MYIRSANMHSDFARRIAAEYGTILHEHGFCAVQRCCDCRVGNFDRRARKVGRYVAAYGVKVGYLVRERYLGGRVYLVSVNVRIAVYRARKRGAVCEHFDYFVFLRRYGYYDRIAEVRLAVGYARNGAVSVRVVLYARIHDGGNRRVDIGSRSRERVLGELIARRRASDSQFDVYRADRSKVDSLTPTVGGRVTARVGFPQRAVDNHIEHVIFTNERIDETGFVERFTPSPPRYRVRTFRYPSRTSKYRRSTCGI